MGVAVIAALALMGLFLRPQAAAAGGETFTVDSDGDDPDSNPGDCVCATSGGKCTLRAAIQEANACAGGQTIRFSSAPMLIYPSSALPPLTDDHTIIDGSDRWLAAGSYEYPGVNLEGDGNPFHGLQIQCSYCAVYGLMVTGFGYHGIYVSGGAQYSEIGGNGSHRRNVVSVNGWNGIRIDGATTTSNTVAGNYVGTNPIGTADSWGGLSDWGNGWHGISVWYGSGNQVSDNLVGGNGWSGITADSLDGVLITSNRIGVSVDDQPLGNTYYGVHIGNGAQDVSVLSNTIAFNQRGIYVTGSGSSATIEHNAIYSNTATALSPPQGGGVLFTNGGQGIIRYNDILSNTAQSGGGIAVTGSTSWAWILSNRIQANRALASGSSACGGGIYAEDSDVAVLDNDIVGNTVEDQGGGGGVSFHSMDWGVINDNEIRDNRVRSSVSHFGSGIEILWGGDLYISGNRVVMNREAIGAIYVAQHSAASGSVEIARNWVAQNSGVAGGAVSILESGGVEVENNVIAHNFYPSGLMASSSSEWVTSTNNTIVSNGWDGVYLYDAHLALFNNIIASNGDYGIRHGGGSMDLLYNGNNVWDNGDGPTNISGVNFYMEEDPQFFDAAGYQYGLRAGSPCIDAAIAAHAPSDSYNGLSRPQGGGPDIGAYEMAPPVYLPMTMRGF
jgi:CSLREA domain-containing protein